MRGKAGRRGAPVTGMITELAPLRGLSDSDDSGELVSAVSTPCPTPPAATEYVSAAITHLVPHPLQHVLHQCGVLALGRPHKVVILDVQLHAGMHGENLARQLIFCKIYAVDS